MVINRCFADAVAPKRHITLVALVLLAIGAAHAQTYPARPVRLIESLAPGSASDIVSRLIAERLQPAFGQPVVVENRPGADGMVAAEFVSKTAPDGYTLLHTISGPLTIAPSLYPGRTRYDAERDLAPITQVQRVRFILTAGPQFRGENLKDLILYTQANPHTAALGHLPGVAYLMALQLKQATGADVQLIAFKGSPQLWIELLGGRIQAGVDSVGGAHAQIRAGKLKALAVMSHTRSEIIPHVATVEEQGYPQIGGDAWTGLFTRSGAPPEIIDRVRNEVVRILTLPDVQQRLRETGIEIQTGDSQALAGLIHRDRERWAKVIRDFQVKPED